MKQKQKTCTKRTHRDLPIQGVCLEDHCQKRPYVCQRCISERHKGHLVLTFNYLQAMQEEVPNQQAVQSSSNRAVQNLYSSVTKVCRDLFITSSAKMQEELKDKEVFAKMISSNLQNVKINQIIRQIITQKDISQETMTQYINVLRTYYFEGGYNRLHIPNNSYKIESGIQKIVQESEKQIEVIIKNLASKIIKFQQNKAIQEPQVKEQNLEEESPIFFKRRPKPQMMEVMEDNNIKTNSSQRNKQTLLKFNLFRNAGCESERMKKIIIRQTKQAKVNQLVYCIDVNEVEELTIVNTGTVCAVDQQSVKQIAKMTKLKRLGIFWTRGMQADQVILMTKYMTDLEELCLCELDICSVQLVQALKINNPKLHKIVFSLDLKHFVRFYEENLELMLDTNYFYTPQDIWIDLTNGLRNISNIQLNFPQKIAYWTNFLEQNKKNLRQFTLMACKGWIQKYKQQYKAETQDKSAYIKALQKCSNLQCLRLEQITFKQKNLLQVVKNNKKLISLYFCECPTIKTDTYRNIFRLCPQLQELSVQVDDNFTGSDLSNLTSLKTLVLRSCWGVNQKIFVTNLSKLKNLKCLVLDFDNYWVTGQTISALQTLQNLKVLNISNNHLSASDIKPLRKLHSLSTLICYNNWFSHTELFKFPLAKILKKLSISKDTKLYPKDDEYEAIDMKDLVLNFPALTHLKLNGFCGIIPDYFELIYRLICVTVINAPSREITLTKKYCQQSKIYFNYYEEDEIGQQLVKYQIKDVIKQCQ